MFRRRRCKIDKVDFVIAGAQKSGTTALHYFLSKHPQITMGDQQEIHFFDDETIFAGEVDYGLLLRHYPEVPQGIIAGDCTPIYLYWKPAMERIQKYNPRMKLLILLRNPIERAFAHWNMQRFKGREPLEFLRAIKAEEARAAEEAPLQSRRYSYIDRGRYAEQLQRVFKFFPRDQVKVIKAEEFLGNNRKTLDSVFGFLGLRSVEVPAAKDRNVVPYEREMTADERRYLCGILAAEIEKVERMLNWDCADWKAS
jgi:Sulfotransferase domain